MKKIAAFCALLVGVASLVYAQQYSAAPATGKFLQDKALPLTAQVSPESDAPTFVPRDRISQPLPPVSPYPSTAQSQGFAPAREAPQYDPHQEIANLAVEASALMTAEEREKAKAELVTKIAELKARSVLEVARKQLESIIQNQPNSDAAATARRMLTASEIPKPQGLDADPQDRAEVPANFEKATDRPSTPRPRIYIEEEEELDQSALDNPLP